jgi:transcriptional regulator with XRE-family HTH domain
MTLTRMRQQANLTVMELAKHSGLKPSVLSALEHGRRPPTDDEAWALSICFEGTPGTIRAACEESRQETAKIVATLEAVASGGPLPEGVDFIISCSRGRGCKIHRGRAK